MLFVTITSVSYGNNIKEIDLLKETEIKSVVEIKSEDDFGRQCCTKAYVNPTTNEFYSFTACAGWFLSNDATAMSNACSKADKMLKDGYEMNEISIGTLVQ